LADLLLTFFAEAELTHNVIVSCISAFRNPGPNILVEPILKLEETELAEFENAAGSAQVVRQKLPVVESRASFRDQHHKRMFFAVS
jgi:hypothetical protein